MALDWKVVHGGKTLPPGEVVRPDERLSWGRTVGPPSLAAGSAALPSSSTA
jgi:hypothetical protein